VKLGLLIGKSVVQSPPLFAAPEVLDEVRTPRLSAMVLISLVSYSSVLKSTIILVWMQYSAALHTFFIFRRSKEREANWLM
jgi:hypothetical protein